MRYDQAKPGTLKAVFDRDADGDPRYTIYDDEGKQRGTDYCFRFWPFSNARIRRKARRKINSMIAGGEDPLEVIVDREKYNRYLETTVLEDPNTRSLHAV